MNLTIEEVRRLLNYDPETGLFTWAIPRRGVNISKPVGCVSNVIGYRLIGLGFKKYYAHRLAWLWVKGEWPQDEIDHINGNRDDNRIQNLREANRAANRYNARRRLDSTTGYKGVIKLGEGRFRAIIKYDKKRFHLGVFRTAVEAHKHYIIAAQSLHGKFANDGVGPC
jgi:hypothetical protein